MCIHTAMGVDFDPFDSDVLYDLSSSNESVNNVDQDANINKEQNNAIAVKYYNNGSEYMETTENINKYPVLRYFILSNNIASKKYNFEYFNNISSELIENVSLLEQETRNKDINSENDSHLKSLFCAIAYTILMDANHHLQLNNNIDFDSKIQWKNYIANYLDEKVYLGVCNKLIHINDEFVDYNYDFALNYI